MLSEGFPPHPHTSELLHIFLLPTPHPNLCPTCWILFLPPRPSSSGPSLRGPQPPTGAPCCPHPHSLLCLLSLSPPSPHPQPSRHKGFFSMTLTLNLFKDWPRAFLQEMIPLWDPLSSLQSLFSTCSQERRRGLLVPDSMATPAPWLCPLRGGQQQ